MAKVAFQIIAFESDEVLEPCLKSIAPYGPIVATEGPVAYWHKQGYMTSGDRTNDLLRKYCGGNVAHGQWKEKDEMMQVGARMIPQDTTHVWMVDCDEIWKAEDVEKVISMLDDYDSMAFKPYSFFGGFERYMTGFEEDFSWQRIQRWYPGATWVTHRPPTVLAEDGAKWSSHRHLSNDASAAMGIHFFHYSYTFPRATRRKTEYYEYREKGRVIPDYFRQVYLPWVLSMPSQREALEKKWQGVHNWLPKNRGDCYTRKFEGEHPQVIKDAMPKLFKRFVTELARKGK